MPLGSVQAAPEAAAAPSPEVPWACRCGVARDGVDVVCGHRDAPLGLGGHRDLLDPVVAGVGYEQVTGLVDRQALRMVQQRRVGQRRGGRRAAVPGGSGDRRTGSSSCRVPESPAAVGDGPHWYSRRPGPSGCGCCCRCRRCTGSRPRRPRPPSGLSSSRRLAPGVLAVLAEPAEATVRRPGSHDGVDVPGGHRDAELGVAVRGDLLDPVARGVGNEDVAGRIGSDPGRGLQPGRGGRAAIAFLRELARSPGPVGNAGRGRVHQADLVVA